MSIKGRGKMRNIKLKIAICDDEEFYRNQIKKLIVKHLNSKEVAHEITFFSSGLEFCQNEVNLISYDIVFLDIEMEKMNGIETAYAIREKNRNVAIVFITVMIDYVLKGYEINALRYIMKDNMERLLPECLDSLLAEKKHESRELTFSFTDGYQEICIDELLYIESKLHKLCFVMENKILYLYEKLDDLEKELSTYNFIRCHQSFLVNLGYVVKVKNYHIYLLDGTEIPIAKPRYPFVKMSFLRYKEVY